MLDDAAVIAPLPGHELVAKTDAIVGGAHRGSFPLRASMAKR